MKKKLAILAFVLTLLLGSTTALAAVKTMPDGGRFDAAFYASTYPDVAAAFGNNETLLYQHFVNNGRAEGRRPYAEVKVMPDGGLFDAAFYAATYPDVAAAFGNNETLLYRHYVTNGKAEGRLPYAMSGASAAPVQDTSWKNAYLRFLAKKHAELNGANYATYALIDIDGNSVPELFSDYGVYAYGASFCTYGPGGIATEDVSIGGFYYYPGTGICSVSAGKMGHYWDDVYVVQQGKIARVHRGEQVAVNPFVEDMVFNCTWDGTPVSEAQYRKLLNSVINYDKAASPYDAAVTMVDYSTIVRLIQQY